MRLSSTQHGYLPPKIFSKNGSMRRPFASQLLSNFARAKANSRWSPVSSSAFLVMRCNRAGLSLKCELEQRPLAVQADHLEHED